METLQNDHAADTAEPLAIRHPDRDPLLGAGSLQRQDPSVPVETASPTEAQTHY
jgi:hypothetical protein